MFEARIMIIDDHDGFREEFKEMLSLSGYSVTAFSDGVSALKSVCMIKPDIIFLDLMMRPLSGFQVAEKLRCLPETMHTFIIAMTAFYTEERHARLTKLYGIKKCFKKPFSPRDVICEIEKVISGIK
jgi:CheY-like chemotaxis protein